MSIVKNLAKAKMESLTVKLHFLGGIRTTCKVVKLLGTGAEVMTDENEKRTIAFKSLVGVDFVDEHVSELD